MNNNLCLIHFGNQYDIPKEINDLCVQGVLVDESWYLDACPSFRVAATGKSGDDKAVVLWIENPKPELRSSSPKRFAIKLHGANRPVLETDSLEDTIGFLNTLAPEQQGDGI